MPMRILFAAATSNRPRRSLPVASAALFAALCLGGLEGSARAHVEVVGGQAFANVTQEIAFGVGHGCSGADTFAVTIDIPAGFTSVRPMRSDFGKASVVKDMAGAITAVTWQKVAADALDADTGYYKLVIRMKPPNTPFTTSYFVAHQTCRDAQGKLTTVDWEALPGVVVPDGGVAPEPAAALKILPARQPGWNKYKAPDHLHDLPVYFKDAVIVWKGTAAYSANANTVALIKATQGVTELAEIHPGDEFWVKY